MTCSLKTSAKNVPMSVFQFSSLFFFLRCDRKSRIFLIPHLYLTFPLWPFVVAPSEFLCKKYNDEEKYNDSYTWFMGQCAQSWWLKQVTSRSVDRFMFRFLSFFFSVDLVKFLKFCFLCLLLFFFHKFMLPICEIKMNMKPGTNISK